MSKRLRIAVIASIAHRTPPQAYGPWEQVASTLTEGLVSLGHEVTLFATGDSTTSATLHAEAPHGYEEDPRVDAKVYEGLHNAAVFERAGDFDVISNQFDFMPLTYSRLVKTPVVTTIHGFSSERILPVYRRHDDHVWYVAISDADRHPDLGYEATIHHGIDLSRFTFQGGPGRYLLFLGRIHPDKGTHLAIEVAQRCRLPLIIAGTVHDRQYFDEFVRPHLGKHDVTYVGAVGPEQRDQLLGEAITLLHLIGFEEPFGLAVVEALAVGTPVVAFGRGSMPEIIRPGITGFLVGSVSEAVLAVNAVQALHRRDCRDDAEARFSAQRMIGDYAELFARIAAEPSQAPRRASRPGRSTNAKRTEESLAPYGSNNPSPYRSEPQE